MNRAQPYTRGREHEFQRTPYRYASEYPGTFAISCAQRPELAEEAAESENISQRGIYFETAVHLKVGTPLEVSLQMPRDMSGKSSSEVRCMARVVHIRTNLRGKGKTGVGLHIEHYEVNTHEGERWAS